MIVSARNATPARTPSPVPIAGEAAYQEGLARLRDSYRAIPPNARVRLAKKTSNLFRARAATDAPGLDVSGLTSVVSVDPETRTADVGGMCTYEDLVAATLPFGLAPTVVPQLKTITLGGAVTGMGIESSSFRAGLPHEAVLSMDILTGSGEVVTAAPGGPHADLFFGFPNSYGTLGYSTRLTIELEPVARYVELRHIRFHTLDELQETMSRIVDTRDHDGEPVDYLDGVVFSATESYLVLGRKTDEPGPLSDYTGREIYYRSIQHADGVQRDRLTTHDYLWRWDTDWFWCSRAFGAQNPKVRRLWPKQLLRSSFYWKLVALDRRWDIGDKLAARKGEPPGERVVQDIEVHIDETVEFLEWFLDEIPIEPIWLCPLRLRDPLPPGADPDRPWPLYPLEPRETYVNIGFWSAVPKQPGQIEGRANRLIEKKVSELGGHKSLYSEAFYERAEFDELYGGIHLEKYKSRYDPEDRLLGLYDKTVRRQ
ncbi:FAD-binding oxidoreductase [Tsukamurella paurometabola]|uniref:Delta(24)-sterol reductase n=1 Tax=Tsukamurella paurometabola TaxID=2061 RepID=A0A3P8KQY9_TSUPA|nr:FAD-binding oxidoreductase [Tsukamurella paurometabola]UEA81726.1 FAD-binding oxidoreductase [Tsukamurella paurometabola]VDR38737.1 Probable decaprenylphosphoryl-beta-D-ribose oxidase [Tsukamurella paurometabola]